MPQCCYIGYEFISCGGTLYYATHNDIQLSNESRLFFRSMVCNSGHYSFVCKKCESVFPDVDSSYGHIISCCCGHIGGSPHIKVRECKIYETDQIKQMIYRHNSTGRKHVTIPDVVLHVSTWRLKEMFPQFMYLRINVEMFKKMDIGNIDFVGGTLVKNLDCYAIMCETWSVVYVIRSIIKEFIRSSEGLEFVCSIPKCRMVYDCLPDMKMINTHIVTHHDQKI